MIRLSSDRVSAGALTAHPSASQQRPAAEASALVRLGYTFPEASGDGTSVLAHQQVWFALRSDLSALRTHLILRQRDFTIDGIDRDVAVGAERAIDEALRLFDACKGPGTGPAWHAMSRALVTGAAAGGTLGYQDGLRAALELHRRAYGRYCTAHNN